MIISVNVSVNTTVEHFKQYTKKLQNLAPFLGQVGQLVSWQMAFNFVNAPWPPLAAITIAAKRALGYPANMLVRTGAMKAAATSGAWYVSNDTATLRVPGYAGFHFEGTRFMPARDFAFLPSSIGPQIEQLFAGYLSAN